MRVLPYGSGAALVELPDAERVNGLRAALEKSPPHGALEVVPAARTLLIRFDPARTGFDRLAAELAEYPVLAQPPVPGGELVVPVRYDGDDLGDVARQSGLTPDEVVRRHTGSAFTVAFCGFAPGYGYLTGLDPALRLPRRGTPRVRVPAGSVAVAGEYSAIYPHESPGGWHLIGRTALRVWDLDRDPPGLLTPGTRVRFTVA
ncbi:5-oxoprolinase subunit B family protein [Amycolatopsis nigrescens]|uniref:5-oxoprolinase subunit B family protein n=1 Tax=Amycolatopsis nigrescens TaxID=381445 RepID=UPI0003754192|nr:allophanate hydrolase subunit 1 [Amycolatopsis nigrescens]